MGLLFVGAFGSCRLGMYYEFVILTKFADDRDE